MKIIISFFYSSLGIMTVYNGSWLFLHYLFETTDSDQFSIWIIALMMVFQMLAIPAIFLLLFLPMYLLQKNFFLQEAPYTVYKKLLCIPMLPVVLIGLLNIHQLTNTNFAIGIASALWAIQYGFYRFIKTIQKA